MLAGAADLDEVRAGADHFRQRRFIVELRAKLVEIGDRQLGAAPYLSTVGIEFAQQQLQQRGLAATVRPQQADLVAALYHA